jgi:hypothetical protein
MIGLDDLAKLDGLATIIIEASPTDEEQRHGVFALLAVNIKRDITRLPNGRWQAIIRLGLADELKVIGRTRADTEGAIDRFAEMMADPAQAVAVYRYFRSLKARAEAAALEVAGDLFTRDGIFNADAKATGQ